VIGLIVSVGVTADSCVVYFERLKEEIRIGRTVRTSVEKGFNRASAPFWRQTSPRSSPLWSSTP